MILNFESPFIVELESGACLQFKAGEQYVPDELEYHPVILAHLKGGEVKIDPALSNVDDQKLEPVTSKQK